VVVRPYGSGGKARHRTNRSTSSKTINRGEGLLRPAFPAAYGVPAFCSSAAVYDEYLVAYKDREAIFAPNVEDSLFTNWPHLAQR
jgi:hypothetical protein